MLVEEDRAHRPSSTDRPDRAYRSYLTFSGQPEARDLALQQVDAWLRSKGIDLDVRGSGYTPLPHGEVVVVHHEPKRAHAFRVLLIENGSNGQWTTSIAFYGDQRGSGWVSIRGVNDQGRHVARPRIASNLLEVLDLRDGATAMRSGAPILRPDDIPDLAEAVLDPERRGLLFVAGTASSAADDGLLFSAFAEKMPLWTRDIDGLAQAVVLDPQATIAWRVALGPTHAVDPWTIRTYYDDLDLGDPTDALRHRIMGHRRLAQSTDRDIAYIVSRAARGHASQHRLPAEAASVLRAIERVQDRLLLDSLFGSDTGAAESTVSPVVPEARRSVDDTTGQAHGEAATLAEGVSEVEVAATGSSLADATVEALTEATPASDTADEKTDQGPASGTDAAEADAGSAGVVDEGADTAPTGTLAETPAESNVEDVSTFLAAIEMAKRVLGVDELTEEALRGVMATAQQTVQAQPRREVADRVSRELEARQLRIDELEEDVTLSRLFADDAELALAEAEKARREAEDHARYLTARLAELDAYDVAYGGLPPEMATETPEDFIELCDWVDRLAEHGVIFTGDKDITRALADQDTLGTIAGFTWECLLACVDYVRAKKEGLVSGNLKQYAESPPQGFRSVPPGKIVPIETAQTMSQFGKQRVFPCPTDFDSSGSVAMPAHFRLARLGMVTPRMHYVDDTGNSGRVIVGYIGPHRRSRQSN